MSDLEVLQPYKVTMSKHKLTVVEMRIMSLILLSLKGKQIEARNKNPEQIEEFVNSISTIEIKNAHAKVGENYSAVKKALKSLNSRQIEMEKDSGVYIFSLIREAYYSNDQQTIKIDISPRMIPELLKLGNNYTRYGLEFIFNTQSSYAVRWYQIGCHWIKNSCFTLTVDNIRELFKVQDTYKDFSSLNRNIIKKPLLEVSEKSDIRIYVSEMHRKGRNVSSVTFRVESKQTIPELANKEKESKTFDLLDRYIREKGGIIVHLCHKFDYDFNLILEKIKNRKVPDVKNYNHYMNMTNKYVATVLNKDSSTKLTIEELICQIKEM